MILIVADTGPINYLIQIGCIDLLPELVDKVVLPSLVRAELLHRMAPEAVRTWAYAPPAWLEVKAATELIAEPDISAADREGISLAKELNAALLLMDDQQARKCAAACGIATIGTIGLLEVAAERNLAVLETVLGRLRNTSFYIADELLKKVLDRHAARRRE